MYVRCEKTVFNCYTYFIYKKICKHFCGGSGFYETRKKAFESVNVFVLIVCHSMI